MFRRVAVDCMEGGPAISWLYEGRDRDDGAYCSGRRVGG